MSQHTAVGWLAHSFDMACDTVPASLSLSSGKPAPAPAGQQPMPVLQKSVVMC